ncbi:MAG: response regulator transcription factor [Stenotrophomonas sp.]
MAEDHLVVAHGVQKLLKDRVQRIDVVPTGEALLAAILLGIPDVVLLDIGMPGISGIETLVRLRLRGFLVPVVMLTMYDNIEMARKCIAAGAVGYVVKQASGDELLTAIGRAVRSEMFISPSVEFHQPARTRPGEFVPSSAQLAVVRLAARGLRAKQIAAELGLSCRTVESHKYSVMQNLGIRTTIELISWAKHEGYI